MSVFRNPDCLSLVVCNNTTLLKLETLLFLFFPNSALRNWGCGLSMDAAYTRMFTVTINCKVYIKPVHNVLFTFYLIKEMDPFLIVLGKESFFFI